MTSSPRASWSIAVTRVVLGSIIVTVARTLQNHWSAPIVDHHAQMALGAHPPQPYGLAGEKAAQFLARQPSRVAKFTPVAREVRTSIEPSVENREALRDLGLVRFDRCPQPDQLSLGDAFASFAVRSDECVELSSGIHVSSLSR